MISYDKLGGRRVELFLPFEVGGKKIEAIEFTPIRFDDTLSWQDRKYKTILALMAKVSGMEESVLRELRYPDIDRVMAVFIDMLPPEIRETIDNAQPISGNKEGQAVNGGDQSADAFASMPQEDRDALGLGVDLDGTGQQN